MTSENPIPDEFTSVLSCGGKESPMIDATMHGAQQTIDTAIVALWNNITKEAGEQGNIDANRLKSVSNFKDCFLVFKRYFRGKEAYNYYISENVI